MPIQTEYEFTLPFGFIDEHGNLHKNGIMRLATAADEILPLKDPRVQQNPAYLTIIVLSRVITKLGDLQTVNTRIIEGLFTADLNYLQELYRRINESDSAGMRTVCPKCEHEFQLEADGMGELYQAIPSMASMRR